MTSSSDSPIRLSDGSQLEPVSEEETGDAPTDDRPTFEVWVDGERSTDLAPIRARDLRDAVSVALERYGVSGGFDPLGRYDVVPAGGSWTDRALCSCEVEETGGPESGPSIDVAEYDPTCPLHSGCPIPRGVERLLDDSEIADRVAQLRRTIEAPYEPSEELRRLVAEEARREVSRLVPTSTSIDPSRLPDEEETDRLVAAAELEAEREDNAAFHEAGRTPTVGEKTSPRFRRELESDCFSGGSPSKKIGRAHV